MVLKVNIKSIKARRDLDRLSMFNVDLRVLVCWDVLGIGHLVYKSMTRLYQSLTTKASQLQNLLSDMESSLLRRLGQRYS